MVRTPKGVMLTAKEFEALSDYSCSLPSGTKVGKRWRCRRPYCDPEYSVVPNPEPTYRMGEYVECKIPGEIGIEWSPIILPPGYVPIGERYWRAEHHYQRVGFMAMMVDEPL